MYKQDGNYWKRRQKKYQSLSSYDQRAERSLKREAQMKPEELYRSPFTGKRNFDANGNAYYEPIERTWKETGIRIFDEYLRLVCAGVSDLQPFYDREGIDATHIDAVSFLLTGMGGQELRITLRLRLADDLLRYTGLSMAEVAKRSGHGTDVNLNYACRRSFNCTPLERRHALQQAGDKDRYSVDR